MCCMFSVAIKHPALLQVERRLEVFVIFINDNLSWHSRLAFFRAVIPQVSLGSLLSVEITEIRRLPVSSEALHYVVQS